MARRLALILRHAPEKFDLEMDINGWIDVKDIIRQFKKRDEKRYHWLRPHHFRAISETDPKGRYEVRGNMIRATYGHTVEIELDLPTDNIPPSLYFPCGPDEVKTLLETGLVPSGRAHVHLSGSIRSAGNAGKVHHDRPVILDVDTETAATRLPAQLDRMEQKGMAFHKRVRQGYLAQAERDPARHLVIDGSRTEEEVFRSLLEGVGARLSTIVAAESAG